jgi:hypothetical protein
VNTVMNRRVPSNVGNFLSSCTAGGFSRRAQLHVVSKCSSCIFRLSLVRRTSGRSLGAL